MFASCVPDLAREAASVVLECSGRLVPLFARSFPGVEVVPRDRARWPDPASLNGVDCALWAGSLPRRYRRERAAFPGTAYLRADPAAVAKWRDAFAHDGAVRHVGLAWTGGLPETARAQRSIALDALAPLFEVARVAYVCLELADRRREAAEVTARGGAPLHCPEDVAAQPDELAALVAALDEIVCVPGTVGHLAGALGRPATILVPVAPTWRYGWRGERMPWYASLRMVRRDPGVPLDRWIGALRDELAARA